MNLRELWGRVRVWYAARPVREQRLLGAAAVIVVLTLFDLSVIEPIRRYRAGVQEEIEDGLNKLQHDMKRVSRIGELKARRDELKRRLEQVKQRLLPGDTGTLGAAALQDRSNGIATEKGITVQSTQVMKEEVAEPFRKVSVRLTLSTEPKPFAEFLSTLEYTQQLMVPFLEVSRRGAVPGQKGPRTMQVSIEIAGFVESKRVKGEKVEEERPTEEAADGAAAAEGAPDVGAEGAAEKPEADKAAVAEASPPVAAETLPPAPPVPTTPPAAGAPPSAPSPSPPTSVATPPTPPTTTPSPPSTVAVPAPQVKP